MTENEAWEGRILARWGWAGENVGIFSRRLEFADGALEDLDLRYRIAGGFQLCADLHFEVGRVPTH